MGSAQQSGGIYARIVDAQQRGDYQIIRSLLGKTKQRSKTVLDGNRLLEFAVRQVDVELVRILRVAGIGEGIATEEVHSLLYHASNTVYAEAKISKTAFEAKLAQYGEIATLLKSCNE